MTDNGLTDWDDLNRRTANRRACVGCVKMDALEHRVTQCKEQLDSELTIVHEAVAALNTEIHGLRSDVSTQVTEINKSLSEISITLKQLADLPEAWSNVRGFLAVNRWIKENLFLLIILGAVAIYAIKSFGIAP